MKRVQVNQDGWKLNGAHQLLVYAVDVNLYWEEAYIIIKKNTKGLVVVKKEIRLEINADKTKYMVMSRHQTKLPYKD
jgi:hypothetical protein